MPQAGVDITRRSRIRDPQALSYLRTDLARHGQLRDPVAAFQKAIEDCPTLAQAHRNVGFAFSQQGKPDEAIARLHEAVRFHPEN